MKWIRYTRQEYSGAYCITLTRGAVEGNLLYFPKWSLARDYEGEVHLYGDAVDRLAEYENTGLSPIEIRELIEKTNKGGDV